MTEPGKWQLKQEIAKGVSVLGKRLWPFQNIFFFLEIASYLKCNNSFIRKALKKATWL